MRTQTLEWNPNPLCQATHSGARCSHGLVPNLSFGRVVKASIGMQATFPNGQGSYILSLDRIGVFFLKVSKGTTYHGDEFEPPSPPLCETAST